MECRAVIESLSDYLDGQGRWMPENEKSSIEGHLVVCPKCQTLKMDLIEIKTAACELPLHTPPRAMWVKIANVLEAELPTSERKTREEFPTETWWERFKARKFLFGFPQMVGAGALAIALVVTGIVSISNQKNHSSDFSLTGAQTALLPDENEIKADLNRRLTEVNQRKMSWAPQNRAKFEQQLAGIENSLDNCRKQLLANPANSTQQQVLRGLYDEKLRLLQEAERLK